MSVTESDIIRNCAPTLAGIKTGNLFACPYESRDVLLNFLRQLNDRLGSKGLRAVPLRFSDRKALIYLYRPGKLAADLSDSAAARLLREQGYCPGSCERCVGELARKLRSQAEFPHEIGLFLGYPPEDVCGFIENRACGCKCVGCWKVYGDEAAARKKFDQYKKCSRVYRQRWEQGSSIERLTVAR